MKACEIDLSCRLLDSRVLFGGDGRLGFFLDCLFGSGLFRCCLSRSLGRHFLLDFFFSFLEMKNESVKILDLEVSYHDSDLIDTLLIHTETKIFFFEKFKKQKNIY